MLMALNDASRQPVITQSESQSQVRTGASTSFQLVMHRLEEDMWQGAKAGPMEVGKTPRPTASVVPALGAMSPLNAQVKSAPVVVATERASSLPEFPSERPYAAGSRAAPATHDAVVECDLDARPSATLFMSARAGVANMSEPKAGDEVMQEARTPSSASAELMSQRITTALREGGALAVQVAVMPQLPGRSIVLRVQGLIDDQKPALLEAVRAEARRHGLSNVDIVINGVHSVSPSFSGGVRGD